jgi:hypothetical protein
MLSWCPNCTLHCMPLMQPSQYWHKNFALSSLQHIKIKISPYAAITRFNVWIRGSNWMQWNPTQLLSLLHLSSIPSSETNVLPRVQPTFTRRTSGHCLGTFIAVNLDVHSFFQEESFKIRNNQQVLPHTEIMERVCTCLKVSPLAYEYRNYVENKF